MKEVDQKAQRDIPGLRKRLSQLLDLVMEILREPLETSEENHFKLMGLCFLSRQVEHTKTVLLLVENNREIDAQLICRSMIEGLAQLLWTARDPQSRALRWRSFVFIEMWRQNQQLKETSESDDENLSLTVQQGLGRYGDLHFRKKAIKRKINNKQLPKDPFHYYWHGDSFPSIFKEIEGLDIYRQIYQPFAAWHHWSPASFGKVVAKDNLNIVFSYGSLASSATILACSFQCLHHSAVVVNHHLKLNFGSRLGDMSNELIAWHKGQNK
jgi:hypothetical protein